MGKKIDSIIEMYSFGVPAPKCIFIEEGDNIDFKINEYFKTFPHSEFYTIRTDTNNSSMSCKRKLSATKKEIISLTYEWSKNFQIILQEFIDERNEVKSGNIYLKDGSIIIEGANSPHYIFTNGKALDTHLIVKRFDSYVIEYNKFYSKIIFSQSEIIRLLRLARKIPYSNAIIEFSFFKNGSLYFWEIKRETKNKMKKLCKI